MKKWITALGACATFSALPTGAFAHGYNAGDAALGGFVGGLIGSGAAPVYVEPAPVVVTPAPVVVPAPAPVVVKPYESPAVVYGARPGYDYSPGRYYPYYLHDHGHHRHHHHDDGD
jgi:PXPV repeat (3 copies)